MKKFAQVKVIAPMALLASAMLPSLGYTQQHIQDGTLKHERTATDQDAAWRQQQWLARMRAIEAAHNNEEKQVRSAYLKLMRYHAAYVGELAASRNVAPRLGDQIQFKLSNVSTGMIEEILDSPLEGMVTRGVGKSIRIEPLVYSYKGGPEHLMYKAEVYDAEAKGSSENWEGLSIADVIKRKGHPVSDIGTYTSYDVTLYLGTLTRSYRALALYGRKDALQSRANIEIIDNIVGREAMARLLTDELPPVRAPWITYIRSATYVAMARRIKQAREEGRELIERDALPGYLPGDNLVPTAKDARMGIAAACVLVSVGSLQASMPSTRNPVAAPGEPPPAPGTVTVTNNSTTFAIPTSADLIALFQSSSVQMTVTASMVNPSSAASQLSWKVDRDTSDTVATGAPNFLNTTTGPQVSVTPNTAGNFRLICYYDTNTNGAYDSGEELKVLRFAVVRATVTTNTGGTNASFILSGGIGFVAGQADPGEFSLIANPPGGSDMLLQSTILLEGGGSNRKIGVSQMQLGNVGNLLADSATVNYSGSGTGTENPGAMRPMVDTGKVSAGQQPTGGDSAFRFQSRFDPSSVQGTNGTTIVVSSDDPAGFGPWKIVHPTTGTTWASTQGGYDFREFIVGFSNSFPKYYVVFARADWTLRVIGTNSGGTGGTVIGTNSGGTWSNNGSAITIQGSAASTPQALTVVVSGGSPQSGDAAGVQVLGLSYASNHRFTYTP